MSAQVEFDTILLHLPPINLHNIKLFYRGDFEWFKATPDSIKPMEVKTSKRKPVDFHRCRNIG